ncbi:MAG: radical SAM protein [Candidatus Riflebacteria bacterium]|nr:radical SAM protein [Candidatus Riflebacteria bacterium]
MGQNIELSSRQSTIIFPPQWEPSQPALVLPVISGILRGLGIRSHPLDLNQRLYKCLIEKCEILGKRVLENFQRPDTISSISLFRDRWDALQKIWNLGYDPTGKHSLFSDSLASHLHSSDPGAWKTVIESPSVLPLVALLEPDLEAVLERGIDTLIFSAISDTQILPSLAIASWFRSRRPDICMVIGGDAFSYRKDLLPRIHEIVGSLFKEISVTHAESAFSGWFSTPASPNLRFSLPDWSYLDVSQSIAPWIVAPVETARGCPWSGCAFCIHPDRNRYGQGMYHPKPLDLLEQELLMHLSAGRSKFFFVDEAILPNRLNALCDVFGKLPSPISWICYSRLDDGHSLEIFRKARRFGLKKIFWGLESGSDVLMKKFNKGTRAESAERILLDCSKAGIASHLFLMTGFPGETDHDRQLTISLLRRILPSMDPFGFSWDLFSLKAERGTPLFCHPEEFGAEIRVLSAEREFAYQADLMGEMPSRGEMLRYRDSLEETIESILGSVPGIRHLKLSQDSFHLLLLDGCPSEKN